jgi:SurA N-terminal domain
VKLIRRSRTLVLAAMLVGALAACDPRQTGSAAVVGGYRITETAVNSYAENVIDELQKAGAAQPDANTLYRTLISQLIEFRLIDVASEREGIHITQGQIDQLIAQSGGREQVTQQLLEQQNLWLPPELLDELARTVLAQQAIAMKLDPTGTTTSQSTALDAYRLDLAKELGVQVSPRYGAWDASNLTLINGPNDLSTPAPGDSQSGS